MDKNNKIDRKLEKINKKYWDTLEKVKQKRDKELLKYSSCLVYCDCGNELVTTKSFVSDEGEGENNIVTYKCSHCSEESKWNFDLTPVPIKIIENNKKLMMDFIDNDTLGYFKANSSIGEVNIFIKSGYMRVRKEKTSLTFNINDKETFYERDDDILLVADKEINCSGIVIYKPLEKLEFNPDEIVSFDGWKQVIEFNPKIKTEVKLNGNV